MDKGPWWVMVHGITTNHSTTHTWLGDIIYLYLDTALQNKEYNIIDTILYSQLEASFQGDFSYTWFYIFKPT